MKNIIFMITNSEIIYELKSREKEEEFFSTEKNIVRIFYDIFIDDGFFSTLKFAENKKEIIFEKKITINSNKTDIKIFFENKPLLLRKII